MNYQPIEEGGDNGNPHFGASYLLFESREVGQGACGWFGAMSEQLEFVMACWQWRFPPLCRSLTETMSTLDWSDGKWKPYGKDLETALQSQEARACAMWGFLLRRLFGRLSPLFSIGFGSTKTSWPLYRTALACWSTWLCRIFDLSFDFNSHPSLFIGFISATTSWAPYQTLLGSWPTWHSTTFDLSCDFNSKVLFDRLYLNGNQLTSLPDSIGQLTNLTAYDIQFLILFENSHCSLW